MSATPRLLPRQPRSGIAPDLEEDEPILHPEMNSRKDLTAAPNAAADYSCENLIRERAYELYVQRGSHDGYAEQDWLDAELELLSNR
jgi:hypothetical protein